MTEAVESLAAAFLLTRSLCILNHMHWRTHTALVIANLLMSYASFAIFTMALFRLDTDLLGFYLFGIHVPKLPYTMLIVSVAITAVFGRRRGDAGVLAHRKS